MAKVWIVMAEIGAGHLWPNAVFDKAYKAQGEAWRLRKYGCQETAVVEFEMNEPRHEE